MTGDEREIRELSIDTIRGLAMDAVQKANSGHPGTAMALAPLGYTLYRHVLRLNPSDTCLLYTSPSPRDRQKSRMPSSA